MARSVFPSTQEAAFPTLSTKKVPRPGVPADSGDTETQGYVDRVRNYIPTEIVGFFIFVNSLIGPVALAEDGRVLIDGWVALGAVLVGIIACVLTVRSAAKQEGNPAWVLHAAMSIIAFLIWSYAIGAKAFAVLGVQPVPSLSGLLLASFTMISGFLVPSAPPSD